LLGWIFISSVARIKVLAEGKVLIVIKLF